MNAKISKKQIIRGLKKSNKTLDEIQVALMMMFENDRIHSTEVKNFFGMGVFSAISNI